MRLRKRRNARLRNAAREKSYYDTGGVARPGGHDRTTTRTERTPRRAGAGRGPCPFLTGIVVIDSMYIYCAVLAESESKHPSTGSLRRGPSFGLAADGPLGRCAQTRTTARPPQQGTGPTRSRVPYPIASATPRAQGPSARGIRMNALTSTPEPSNINTAVERCVVARTILRASLQNSSIFDHSLTIALDWSQTYGSPPMPRSGSA